MLPCHMSPLPTIYSDLASGGLDKECRVVLNGLNLSKCSFLKSSIVFLGHTVDKSGIHTKDAKIKAI